MYIGKFYVLIFLRIGALTSKPFAFKAWAWELTTQYIIDPTTALGTWLRVDMKGVEIMRLLPWIDKSTNESWISDKAWFFYDGFMLNWVTKYFFRKKLIFLPIFFFLLHILDPLLKKYFKYSWFLNEVYENFTLWNSDEVIILAYYHLYNLIYLGKIIVEQYYRPKIIYQLQPVNFLIRKAWSIRPYFFIGMQKVLLWKIAQVFNFFLVFRWKKLKKNWFYLCQKFTKYSSLASQDFNFLLLLNIFYQNVNKQLNIMPDLSVDLLSLTAIWKFSNYYNNNLKKITFINIFNPVSRPYWIFEQSFYNVFSVHQHLINFDLIYLFNSNIWYSNPKFYLMLWKMVKLNTLIVISIGNSDELLFKHLNFSFANFFLIKFITFWHWLSGFFWQKLWIGLVNGVPSVINKNIFLIGLKKFVLTNYFFLKQVSSFSQLCSIPPIYIFPSSIVPATNIFMHTFITSSQSNFWKKILYYPKILTNTYFSCSYIFTNITSIKNWFLLNFFARDIFNLKRHFFILFESNLIVKKLYSFLDFVLPVNLFIENFRIYKNSINQPVKSLFLKFGPWNSWSFFNFFNFFLFLNLFPFLWYKIFNVSYLTILSCFYENWIWSYFLSNLSRKCKIQITMEELNLYVKSLNLTKKVWFQNKLKFVIRNFWFTEISFIKSSKYVSLGYNLLRYEKISFPKEI